MNKRNWRDICCFQTFTFLFECKKCIDYFFYEIRLLDRYVIITTANSFLIALFKNNTKAFLSFGFHEVQDFHN